jgi:hypothetical protein
MPSRLIQSQILPKPHADRLDQTEPKRMGATRRSRCSRSGFGGGGICEEAALKFLCRREGADGRICRSNQACHRAGQGAGVRKIDGPIRFGPEGRRVAAKLCRTAALSRRTDALPYFGSIPVHSDGSDAHLPRSTSLTFPWAYYNTRIGQAYLQYRQQFAHDWILKLNTSAANDGGLWLRSVRRGLDQ